MSDFHWKRVMSDPITKAYDYIATLEAENTHLKADKAKLVEFLRDYKERHCTGNFEICGHLDEENCSGCKAARLLKEVG